MHDDVDAEVEGFLAYRRGERVVTNEQCSGLMSYGGNLCQVCDAQQRIGRRLNPYQACTRSKHRLNGGQLAEISKVGCSAARARMLAQLFERSVVSLERCGHSAA